MVVGAGARTVNCARPVMPAAVAVTSACPAPTALTKPASSTSATDVSLDAQENSAPATAWPFASVASAARRTVSPATRVSAGGDTVTTLTLWATDTAALPETVPAVAVIMAIPLPAAVTSPDPSTPATGALSLVQVTVAAAITCPFWSRTSALNCTVSPRAVSSAVVGFTVMVVGRGGSGGGGEGSVAPSPQPEAQTMPATSVATTRTIACGRLAAPPFPVTRVAASVPGIGNPRSVEADGACYN